MYRVCFICSAGGHLEQIKQLKVIFDRYESFYVTTRTKVTKGIKEKKYLVNDLDRRTRVRKLFSMIIMFFQQFKIFVKEKPDVIITTGAAIAIPMCFFGYLFRKKVIYIESYARMNTINKSGKVINKFSNLFIVQWESLLEYYPNAVYGGCIY